MIGSILALSIITAAPQFVQGPPAPTPEQAEMNIAQMAFNYCSTFVSTEADMRRCLDIQEEAFRDITATLQLNEGLGRDYAPVLVYCLEREFVGPEMLDLPAIRHCLIEGVAGMAI